jgi:CDP-glycerol glycerophosphotransferase
MKKIICLLLIYLFNLLPIRKNKVFLFSYYGSNYGCNPKYITDYIIQYYPKDRFDIVWAFSDPESKRHLTAFRKVKIMSLRYFYELCTAKVVITNFRTTDLFVKRKNQYYIQTWHSSLRLKQIEKDAEDVLPPAYVQMAKKDSVKCDLLLSGCAYSTAIFKRSFWFDGEIFEHGTPRNDVLFQNDPGLKQQVLKRLNIPEESKILLYAPTFRNNGDLSVYNLEWERITNTLKERFGSEWVVLAKLHPHLISKSDQIIDHEHVIDVTAYDDIQELLLTADILISDYSSLMFDFAITNRPCFLYVPDVDEYTNKDRKFYFDLKELPFVRAAGQEDLLEKTTLFDEKHYKKNLGEFLSGIGSFEEGKAAAYAANRINEICYNQKGCEIDEAI